MRRRNTGPTKAVRELVNNRDALCCVCCGKWAGWERNLQHRVARGMGGTRWDMANSPINLLTMLPACHARVERRGEDDHAKGYWLWQYEDPALIPVLLFTEGGASAHAWPTADGRWVFERPAS